MNSFELVGDKKWEKGMSIFCRSFTKARIKYFDLTEIYKACEWTQEGLEASA